MLMISLGIIAVILTDEGNILDFSTVQLMLFGLAIIGLYINKDEIGGIFNEQ